MAEPNIQNSGDQNPTSLPNADKPDVLTKTAPLGVFPTIEQSQRIAKYNYYEKLFMGEHFEAFNMRIGNAQYNLAYSKLRYVMANFAGLISKICADMLFGEKITIMPTVGDQKFIEGLWHENNMDIQCYESGLLNSYEGDDLFKVRIGKRHKNSTKQSVIIEEVTPKIYFPTTDPFNTRANPINDTLAWVFKKGEKRYLRKEIHTPGLIENQVFEMDGNEIKAAVGIDILGISGLTDTEETGIEESLIVHIPNWKAGTRTFGISDYNDIDNLFYAINNRMSKIDNILDKHSDPILLVPEGLLDDDGKVQKKKLGVIEIKDGEGSKPEYVVWDASLENAMKEIEKLVEFIYMIGEVSPDVLGLGQGVSDSGRALKFKLMRTIAKVARKKLYYYVGLRKVLYIAQLMAKAHGIEVDGRQLEGDPVMPDLRFADGLPIDDSEQIETETKAIDVGITTRVDAAMRVYNLDEAEAKKKIKEIDDEKAISLPAMKLGGDPFKQKQQAPPKETNTGKK